MIKLFYPDTVEPRYNEPFTGLKGNTLRSLEVKTLRIKLYRAILPNFNCKIYIRDFSQHLRMIGTI